MKITVRRLTVYAEISVADGGTTITSGLLDSDEAAECALELVTAAAELAQSAKLIGACDMLYAIAGSGALWEGKE